MASLTNGFNLNNFEPFWNSLDEGARFELVSQAASYPPSLGILPIVEGLNYFQYRVRSAARKNLEKLQQNLLARLYNKENSQEYLEATKDAAIVSARIYAKLKPEMSFADMIFLLETMMGLGEKGNFFILKALYQGKASQDTIEKACKAAGDTQQLTFVVQYLQTSPAIRLKFARLFRRILRNISSRDSVTGFYAALFDRKQDADPFLNNIPHGLRDPEKLIKKEIRSQVPGVRIKGLKALAMMTAKVPAHLLIEALTGDDTPRVRKAVYSLVENSAMGLYPELFEPLLESLPHCDAPEALRVFNALVLTGHLPIHQLMDKVRMLVPQILPDIFEEIASLSRLSFFLIQDIALNKEKYLSRNFDLNQALIFGMILKRPERVVTILKQDEMAVENGLKPDVAEFIRKTSSLLSREKESITAKFALISEQIRHKTRPDKTLLSFVRKDPLKRKLEALRANASQKTEDYTGIHIKDEYFSGLKFSMPNLFFNDTVFENCDFSQTIVIRACFRKTVFYNADMDGAVFENVCFDNAVMINVTAKNAVFRQCSFQGASLYNCNFNQSDLSEAVFIDAVVSKTSFGNADLSCASFVHAKLSGISFGSAHLNLADFSHVRARFSRFPSYASSVIQKQGIDYNARYYQLEYADLPHIERPLVSEINMLIFCEFIHYGQAKFLNQNKLSLLTAYDVFKPSQADLFQLIPLLLHENLEFPGAEAIESETPCGIADFLPSREAVQVYGKYMGSRRIHSKRSFSPYIQGLFVMGSLGSIAQTADSDIDYWVCVDENTMDGNSRDLFRKKIKTLEALAMDKFKIEVNFFIVDIFKARSNDFADPTEGTSILAQSRLLKEEFYRTMIHVAGKLPLWAVLPTNISLNYYNLILDRVITYMDSHRYIDLGDIHAITVNEYFGSSIWQMFQWLKSPFKSVLKMTLLEKLIQGWGKEPLFCNQYKNEWMDSGTHLKLAQNDSYIILLNNLISYYRENDDTVSVQLLLTCFFLKLGIAKQVEIDNTPFGLREILLTQCLESWGWEKRMVFEIGRFDEWPYTSIQRLSNKIVEYMHAKYNIFKGLYENQSTGKSLIREQDWIILERKFDIAIFKKFHRVQKNLMVSSGKRSFTQLNLKYLAGKKTDGQWELCHRKTSRGRRMEEVLIRSQTIEEIGAWLINNRLYTDTTFLTLIPNPIPVSHDDIEKLYRSMKAFFLPDMKQNVSLYELRKQMPRIVSVFISLNFYSPKQQRSIQDFCAVYLNSWGEMYIRFSKKGRVYPNLNAAKKEILEILGIKRFPPRTAFYFSKGMSRS